MASPGGAEPDLLMEAMGLNRQTSMATAEGRGPRVPHSAAASSMTVAPMGDAVDRLPDDWSLKRTCLVTSRDSLGWCVELPTSAQDEALRCPPGTAGSTVLVRLQQALLCWRHPAQKLPSAITKDLSSLMKADQELVDSYRDAWDAALRSLYYGLRSGRLPYFYCRGAILISILRCPPGFPTFRLLRVAARPLQVHRLHYSGDHARSLRGTASLSLLPSRGQQPAVVTPAVPCLCPQRARYGLSSQRTRCHMRCRRWGVSSKTIARQ